MGIRPQVPREPGARRIAAAGERESGSRLARSGDLIDPRPGIPDNVWIPYFDRTILNLDDGRPRERRAGLEDMFGSGKRQPRSLDEQLRSLVAFTPVVIASSFTAVLVFAFFVHGGDERDLFWIGLIFYYPALVASICGIPASFLAVTGPERLTCFLFSAACLGLLMLF